MDTRKVRFVKTSTVAQYLPTCWRNLPDLSPLDYFSFSTSKTELKGYRYAAVDFIREAVTEKLNNIPDTDFSQAVEKFGGPRDVHV